MVTPDLAFAHTYQGFQGGSNLLSYPLQDAGHIMSFGDYLQNNVGLGHDMSPNGGDWGFRSTNDDAAIMAPVRFATVAEQSSSDKTNRQLYLPGTSETATQLNLSSIVAGEDLGSDFNSDETLHQRAQTWGPPTSVTSRDQLVFMMAPSSFPESDALLMPRDGSDIEVQSNGPSQ